MVQTNPASALLGVAANNKGNASNSQSGDGEAFSREFEEVSRSAKSQHGGHSAASEQSGEKPHATAEAANSGEGEAHNPATEGEAAEQETVAAGGKNLPSLAALELEEGEDVDADDDTLTTEQNDDALIQTLLPQETKSVATVAPTEAKPNASQATVLLNSDSSVEPAADDALSFSEQRLRDFGLNLANLGKDGGDNAAAQQGKSDSALFTLVNGNRGATAFGEMLNASSGAMATAAQPTQQTTTTLPAQMSITVPMQQSGWDQAMGERVVWMARSNVQQAQIQLNPRELGPIEIKISVQNDQTHVNFVAHHATTRDAIEAALPRLREMLGEQGLNLGQADVSQHSFGDNQRQAMVGEQGRGSGNTSGGELEQDTAGEEITSHVSRISSNAVDYFA